MVMENGFIGTAVHCTMRCVLYTGEARINGQFGSAHWRLSDAMNALKDPLLRLRDVEVRSLNDGDAPLETAGEMFVRVRDIVVCIPGDFDTENRRSQPGMPRAERAVSKVALSAAGLPVAGEAYYPPASTLFEYLSSKLDMFLPLTNGTVGDLRAPFLLVAHEKITRLMELDRPAAAHLPESRSTPRPAAAPAPSAGANGVLSTLGARRPTLF